MATDPQPAPQPSPDGRAGSSSSSSPTMATKPSHPYNYEGADLILRSSDGVDFRVHKVVLALSSSFFRDFPFEIHAVPGASERDQGLPVILLSDNSEKVAILLHVAYPGHIPPLHALGDTRRLLEVGTKYIFSEERLHDAIKSLAIPLQQPLYGYALGSQYMVQELALACARELLKKPGLPNQQGAQQIHEAPFTVSTEQTTTLEDELPAALTESDLLRLSNYRQRCVEAALSVVHPAMGDFLTNLSRPFCVNCGNCGAENPKADDWFWNPRVDGYIEPTQWTLDYLEDAKCALETAPHEDSVCDPELVGVACARASNCDSCRPKASMNIIRMSGILRGFVKDAVDQVRTSYIPLFEEKLNLESM